MKLNKIIRLIAAIAICQLTGAIGSLFTMPAIATWYATLQKPWFTPPSWLFAPVWITLYTLLGISFYLAWEKGMKNKKVRVALIAFGVQLALNTIWSILFFGLRSPSYGFIGIAALWAAIAATILRFYKISRKAAMLLLPYIAWVTIAVALNYYVLVLNP